MWEDGCEGWVIERPPPPGPTYNLGASRKGVEVGIKVVMGVVMRA